MKDFPAGIFVCNAETFQKFLNGLQIPAGIVDTDIQNGVQAEGDGAVQAEKFHNLRVCLQEAAAVFISHIFHISGPTFHITAAAEKMPDGGTILLSEMDGLVQMAGKTFVGQGGET